MLLYNGDMDFDAILSEYKTQTCIMSVEKFEDGGYGNIRIVAGNKPHCDDMLQTMCKPFVPDSPYAEYFPQDKNFEDFCYRSAILGQPLHTYVPLPQMGLWLNMFLLPLNSDKENTGYCIYSYNVSPAQDSEQRASLSADTASAVLQTCIKLRGSTDILKTFREVIEDIRQLCGSDHCCILLSNDKERKCINFCESLKPDCGLLSINAYINENFFDTPFYNIMKTWDKTIGDSTCVIIKDEQDRKWIESTNPVWYKSMQQSGVKSIVLFPLTNGKQTMGYIWAINFNVDNTVKIKETLELTTFFIASEISNYLLLQNLETLSSMDLMTGVKNRNTMNVAMDDLVSGRKQLDYPYSVIFADLNGLKQVNDEKGHAAGDELLKSAATVLQKTFGDYDIYRVGGDEFMIIAEGLDKKDLNKKIKSIRSVPSEEGNICFAIGSHVAQEGEDIRTVMRLADEKMYADKKKFYQEHPETKYR